ncbi:MAG TPA: c-type cytochrome biogenesis protein CcmI [Casimicrobiaceae bacterium]
MPPAPLFWLVALLLVAATVAALVWPLLRTGAARPTEVADSASTDVYRDQKRQVDDELAAGAIDRAERDAQLAELAARLGQELRVAAAPPAIRNPSRNAYVTALILVAAIPASALLLYAVFGSPDALRTAAPAEAPASHTEIVAMVDKLATRMNEHPEDPTGWRLLARAQSALGRYPEAVAAFNEAAKRSPEDAALLADWADALAMQNQSLQGEPSRLVARALALDPNHPKSLSLAATAALERKDYPTAIAQWRRLKMQYPPGSEETKDLDTMITEADAAQRGAPAPPSPGAPAASASGAPAERASAPAAASAAADASAITGRVSLDPKLRERVAAADALFIFARAVNGPRMPLAVLRATAGELPRRFVLDDAMAMTPAARISAASEVTVEARISKSGSATPSAGDLQGISAPVKPGTHGLLIVINDVVR